MTLGEANDKANLLGRRYGKHGWGCIESTQGWFLVGQIHRDGEIKVQYGSGMTPGDAFEDARQLLTTISEPVSEPERADLLMAARLIPSEVLVAVLKERGDHLPDAEVA